jgi:hypothetical protein
VEDKALRCPTAKSGNEKLVVKRPPVHALHDDMNIGILCVELADQAEHRSAIRSRKSIPKADSGLLSTADHTG